MMVNRRRQGITWDPKNNPYNFAPFDTTIKDNKEIPRLSSFQQLNGSIACKLTTETPLLIAQKIEAGTPAKRQFYQESGKYIIPGSSLKGMLRSVLEAVTNACFSVFDGERLDYRHTTIAQNLKAGKIISMPEAGKAGEIQRMERGWVAMDHWGITVSDGEGNSHALAPVPKGVKSGDPVWVKTKEFKSYRTSTGRTINAPFYIITDIKTQEESGYTEGIIKITKQSIPNKKRERIFFPAITNDIYTFTSKEEEDYNYILEHQKDRWEKNKDFDFEERHELEKGALVYFEPYTEAGEKKAKNISRVEVPRIRYVKSRKDLLPEDHRKCKDSTNLCTACKLFGYVEGDDALSGRVSISDAELQGTPNVASNFFPLKVLGTPHPTSYNFYLRDPNDPATVRNYDGYKIEDNRGKIGTDKGTVQLRGRKFYYHHPNHDDLEYYQVNPAHSIPSSQYNEAQPLLKNNTFPFDICFRNLSKFELGLLLYCLVLEGNLRHKLGMGKPIGFGTVQIEIDSLLVEEEPSKKYQELAPSPPPDQKDKVQDYSRYFKGEIKRILNDKELHELETIKALQILLDPSKAPAEPAYPSPDGYQWYMNHRDTPLPDILSTGSKSILKTSHKAPSIKPKPTAAKPEAHKIGDIVRGMVFKIERLNGMVRLGDGEELPFKKQNEYQPIDVGQRAILIIKGLTPDGKIAKLELKEGR